MSKEKLEKNPVTIQRKLDDWNDVHTQLQMVQRKEQAEESTESLPAWSTSFTVGFLPGSVDLNVAKVTPLNTIGGFATAAGIVVDVKGGSKNIKGADGEGAIEAARRAAAVGAELTAGGATVTLSPQEQPIRIRLGQDPPVRYGDFETLGFPDDMVMVTVRTTGNAELTRNFVRQINQNTAGLSEQN